MAKINNRNLLFFPFYISGIFSKNDWLFKKNCTTLISNPNNKFLRLEIQDKYLKLVIRFKKNLQAVAK